MRNRFAKADKQGRQHTENHEAETEGGAVASGQGTQGGLRRQVGVLVHESHVREAPASAGHKSRSPGMGLAVSQDQPEAQGRSSHPPPPQSPRESRPQRRDGPTCVLTPRGSLPTAQPGQESQRPLRAGYGSASNVHASTLPTSLYEHSPFLSAQPRNGLLVHRITCLLHF